MPGTAGLPAFDATTACVYDDAGGKVSVTTADGLTKVSAFDRAGQLVSVVQANGQATWSETRYSYDADGRLRMTQDPTGLRSYIVYDGAGRKVADIASDGALTEYTYDLDNQVTRTLRYSTALNSQALAALLDADGQPTDVTLADPGSAATSSSIPRPVPDETRDIVSWNFYDDAHRLVKTVDALGFVVEWTYDGAGRLVQETHFANAIDSWTFASDPRSENAMPFTDPSIDRTTRYFYDGDGMQVAMLDPEGYFSETTFDAAGRKVRTTRYELQTPLSWPQSGVTKLWADGTLEELRAAQSPSAGDMSEYFAYDARGKLRWAVDGNGYATAYGYDANGNLTRTVHSPTVLDPTDFFTPRTGLPLSFNARAASASGEWPVVEVLLDGVSVGTVTVDSTLSTAYTVPMPELALAQAHTVDFVFQNGGAGGSGDPQLWIDSGFDLDGPKLFDAGSGSAALDGQDTSEYGQSGSELALTGSGALRATLNGAVTLGDPFTTAPGVETQLSGYDAFGRLLYSASADGTVTQYGYDAAGRLILQKQAQGTSNERTTRFRFDVQGRLAQSLDAEGCHALEQLGAGATQAQIDAVWAASSVRYAYDAAGRRISTTDALGHRTLFYYDLDGRLAYTIDGAGGVSRTDYNAMGQVQAKVDYSHALAAQVLSGLQGGRADAALAVAIDSIADGATDVRQSWQYDAKGEMAQAYRGDGELTASYEYDAFGELGRTTVSLREAYDVDTDIEYDRRGLVTSTTIDSNDTFSQTSTEYDAFGRVVATEDGRGNVTTTQYLKSDGTPDGGRAVVVTDPTSVSRTTVYDFMDRVVKRIDGLGHATIYSYDVANRRLTTVTPERISTVSETNREGQVVSVTDGTGAVTRYDYDLDGRLLTTTDPLGNVAQNTYDLASNLIEVTTGLKDIPGGSPIDDGSAVTTRYEYDAANRVLRRRVDPDGLDLVTGYSHDGQGRIVQTTDADGKVHSYHFNANGELDLEIADDVPGGLRLQTAYSYDLLGHTLSVTEGYGTPQARVTAYRYDGAGRRTEEIVDQYGISLRTTYEYDEAGNLVLKRDPQGQAARYVYDEDNRLTCTIDPTGAATQHIYDDEGRLVETRKLAQRLGENHAEQIWMQPGTNSSVSSFLGHFAAGDVVTATVRFKADSSVVGSMFLGQADGANTFDPDTWALAYGSTEADGWQTLTVTRTLSQDQDLWIYLYGDRYNSLSVAGNSVLYDDVRVTSAQKGQVFADGFEGDATTGNGPAWSVDGEPGQRILAGSTAVSWSDDDIASALTALAGDADEVTRIAYDEDGRAQFTIDGEGGLTESRYDDAGRVVESIRYAKPVTGEWTEHSLPAINAAEDQHTLYVYDAAGQPRFTIDASDHVAEAVYDRGGRVIETRRYASAIIPPAELTVDTVAAAVAAVADSQHDRVDYQVYDAAGRQRFFIDGEGGVTEQQFDWLGRVKATLRHSISLDFTECPTLEQVSAALSQASGNTPVTTTREYDAAGRLTDLGDADGITHYVYDSTGQVTDEIHAYGLPEATTIHRVYDNAGRLTEETAGYGTASASTTLYRYDGAGRIVAKIDPRGVAEAAAPGLSLSQQAQALDRYTTRYGYDAAGRRTTVIDPAGGTATTEYDAFGNAVKVTDPRGNSGYTFYDRRNFATLVVDPEGFAVSSVFDGLGNKTSTTQYANRLFAVGDLLQTVAGADAAGLPLRPFVSSDPAHDSTIAYEYDRLGRLSKRIDAEVLDGTADRAYETYSYDAFGNRTAYRNKAGGEFSYTYDRRGLQLTETRPVSTRNAAGQTIAVVNRSVYDALGNRVQFIEAEGAIERRTTRFQYDALGRVTATEGDALTLYEPGVGYVDGVVPTTSTEYDAHGNVTVQTDAKGHRTVCYYDALQRKIGQVDAAGVLSTWAYDAAGNVLVQKVYGDPIVLPAPSSLPAPVNAANVRETRFTYDANNRQTQTLLVGVLTGHFDDSELHTYIEGAAYGLDHVQTSREYDAAGNVVKTTSGNGGVTYSFYDRDGQKVFEVDPEGYAKAWVRGVNGVTVREIDFAQRSDLSVDEHANPIALLDNWPTSADDRITDYTYDRDFRVLSESRRNVAYANVDAGNGQLSEGSGSATTTYAYDGLDKKIRQIDANGKESDWHYDSTGRLQTQQLPGFTDFEGDAVRSTTEFEYDGLDQLVRTIQRGKNGATEADDEITRFVYGSGGRLSQRIDADQSATNFAYDAAGNVTLQFHDRRDADGNVVTDGTVYDFDALNREVSRQSVTMGATWTYGDLYETRYDAYGEVTGKRTNGGNAAGEWQEFAEYNALGKVVKSNFGTGVTSAYVYDADGNETLRLESAGADLRALPIDNNTLNRPDVYETYSLYDRRDQLLQTSQPHMDATRDQASVTQILAQQVSVSASGGENILAKGALLSTTPAGPAQSPALTDTQRYQPLSTVVHWGVNTVANGEGGYDETGTHIDSMTVNLPVDSIGQQMGNWSAVHVVVTYALKGSTNRTGTADVRLNRATNGHDAATTVNLGLIAGIGDVNFNYTVTVSYEYADGTAPLTVASARVGNALAWETTAQTSDGEGGYTTAIVQNFAAANAFDSAFQTADLGQFATIAPSAGVAVSQARVGTEITSATAAWGHGADPSGSQAPGRQFVYVQSVTVHVDAALLGQVFGTVQVVLTYSLNGVVTRITNPVAVDVSQGTATFALNLKAYCDPPSPTVTFGYTATVQALYSNGGQILDLATVEQPDTAMAWTSYVTVNGGQQGPYQQAVENFAATNAFDRSAYSNASDKTFFMGHDLVAATRAYLYYRTSADAPYTGIILTRATSGLSDLAAGGTPAAGVFYSENAWLPSGIVDYKIVAMSGTGADHDDTLIGSFNGTSITSTTSLPSRSQAAVGEIFFDSYPAIHFFDQQGADRLRIEFRRTGTNDGWQQVELSPYENGGWFSWAWQAAGLSGQYDMRVFREDANGNVIARMFTRVDLDATPTATPLVPYTESDIVIGGLPANTASVNFQYRVAGSGGGYASTWLENRGSSMFGRDFSQDNLLPDPTRAYTYEYKYTVYDTGGQILRSVGGTFEVAATGGKFLSSNPDVMPTVVRFNVAAPEALGMDIAYRPLGSTGAFTVAHAQRASNADPFKWDVSAITPDSGSVTYEYQYRLYDASGNPALNPVGDAVVVDGEVTLGETTDGTSETVKTGWSVDGLLTSNFIQRSQTHNAFGEVDSETDGNTNVTRSYYNTLGDLVLRQDPTTDVTGENGVTVRGSPETRYYYDLDGRAVGTRDANGNLTTRIWVDGLGDPKVAKEFRPGAGGAPDGSNVSINDYDLFGNLRMAQDGEGRQTRYAYDLKNQLTRMDLPTRAADDYLAGQAAFESYKYDSDGNRISTTGVLGRTRTYYDQQGRVTKFTSAEGRDTSYAYTYDNTITGAGGKQVGGWLTTTTMIGGVQSRDAKDVFGRMVSHRDFGGHAYTYRYDLAGWITSQTSVMPDGVTAGQNLTYAYYANGYLAQEVDHVNKIQSAYTYDNNGNRVSEDYRETFDNGTVFQHATISYDELNRVALIHDAKYDIRYKYDAVGNRRNVFSYYNDGVQENRVTQDLWYKYDALNRFLVTMGTLQNGVIVAGQTGKAITYDNANQRRLAEYVDPTTGATIREAYTYTSDGYLQSTKVRILDGSGWHVQADPASYRANDLAGRVVGDLERKPTDNSVLSDLTRSFDNDNRQLTETDATSGRSSQYVYVDSSGVDDGTLQKIITSGTGSTQIESFAYQWWDAAKQTDLKLQVDGGPEGWAPGVSHLIYDLNGNLFKSIDDNAHKTVQYRTDGEGQILFREEKIAQSGSAPYWDATEQVVSLASEDRRRSYYYANGHRVGDVNNDGGPASSIDYAVQLSQDKSVSNDDRYKKTGPTAYANFDENYQPINEAYPGTAPTQYTVAEGDTLGAIAARLWGDRAMWYLIAEANGLTGTERLVAGTHLVIPNKVTNIHNNAGTFKPYDAGEAIGDLTPTLPPPPPPPDRDCGGLGTIVMVAIAVAVTAWSGGTAASALGSFFETTAGTLGGALTTAGGFAAGGALGSIASQGFAIATGMQDKFDWRAVSQSALASGITMGVSKFNVARSVGGFASESWQGATINAAASSGLNMAVHGDWNWQALMASAVGGAIGENVGSGLQGTQLGHAIGNFGQRFAGGWAGAVAGAAVDNEGGAQLRTSFVGAFGNALGESLVDAASSGSYGGQGSSASPYVVQETGEHIVFGSPYQPDFPDTQQFVGAFGDGLVPQRDPSNNVLLAAGDGFTMGRGRISISPPINRKVHISDDLAELSDAELIARANAMLAASGGTNLSAAGDEELEASVLYQQGLGDIRESVSVLSSPSSPADPFATPDSVAAEAMGPAASYEDSMRALTSTESFFTFNPAGKFLSGVGEGIVDLVGMPVKLAQEAVLTTTDTIGHSVTGTWNWLANSSLHYRSDSGLYKSVETNGVIGTAVLGITGTVKGLLSPIDALYRHDPEALGRSGPLTILAAAGPLGWASKASAAGLSFEDALVLQGDASRARIVQQIGDAAQPTLQAIRTLDPNARVGSRGSLASGLKNETKLGLNGERVPFDGFVKTWYGKPYTGPQGYDADYFIVSDNLADRLGRQRFMDATRLKDPALRMSLNAFGDALRSNPGLSGMKLGKPQFRVFSTDDMLGRIPPDDPQYYFILGGQP